MYDYFSCSSATLCTESKISRVSSSSGGISPEYPTSLAFNLQPVWTLPRSVGLPKPVLHFLSISSGNRRHFLALALENLLRGLLTLVPVAVTSVAVEIYRKREPLVESRLSDTHGMCTSRHRSLSAPGLCWITPPSLLLLTVWRRRHPGGDGRLVI